MSKNNSTTAVINATLVFLYIISGIFLIKTTGLSAVIGWIDLVFGIFDGVLIFIVYALQTYIDKLNKNKAKNSATIEIKPHSEDKTDNKTDYDTKNSNKI